jgi:hypothetical protein
MSILPNATLISPGNPFYGSSGGSGGVTSIVAGTGMTISPTNGLGAVTVNNGGVLQVVAGTNVTVQSVPVSPNGLGVCTVNALPFFPGMIMMYNALPPTVLPLNWFLCDGGTYNGFIVPDLRDKFIVCTGPINSTIGLTGGAASTTLTLNMIPDHTHNTLASVNSQNAALATNSGFSTCNPSGPTSGIANPGYTPGTPVPTLPPYFSLAYICYCGTG